ncbi:heavy metal translocating P-type ATPase [Coprobacillus sp. AF33-1AC]|uniref:heavy metal translocating P-type ATPase n=1 Tax=Coprobacillus sp. AF33-1AC TaxID=2292032 RepID=UPI000E54F918|nr:heavy metal translocating P-type ATPase [Coprobacillus sp. AF33-1AC]RHM60896.1 heavy metal translocating P-type ATPase [Coprobacillus sp. AF33-1AC]
MEHYAITGMSCAACSNRVEKAVSKVSGVTSCSVSLLTNAMSVEGTASSKEIIKAVKEAGYGAKLQGQKDEKEDDLLEDHETPALKKRLIASLFFLIILMYFSMGHMMWGWPLPSWFNDNHIAMGIVQMLLAGIIMVINQKFFISGFKSLWHRSPNMDTLVALGSMASFVWSVYALLMMTRAQVDGQHAVVMKYMMEFYFESAAMILTLITVGKMLEARSKGKTTNALKGLMNLAPKKAVILKDNQEVTVAIDQVLVGDIFVVRPGESIPVDGVIIEGNSALDASALTGESIPVDKTVGDQVSSASINQSGFLKCRATRVGQDTTLSQIIKMVSDVATSKAPIAKVADQVSGVFVPVVIGIAVVTFIIWILAKGDFSYALARSISVLVISCPCALGLATPVAIMVGNGVGAKHGILFKSAESLEETGRVQIVALDKTGTITKGQPKVVKIETVGEYDQQRFIKEAVSLESKSEHPLARAIIEYAKEKGIQDEEVSNFEALPGHGLKAKYYGKELVGGSLTFIEQLVSIPQEFIDLAMKEADLGRTPLLFALDHHFIGMISVADVIKEESPQAIKELHQMGIQVVMITGDNEKTAKAIAKQVGVDEVIAGVLPDGKVAAIQKLKSLGKVAMVGDGLNDAPALTQAHIGIAIGAGSDVAIDAAEVVLMNSRLSDVSAAIRLSRATLRNIHENLFWAFIYNIIGIPLAAGIWIPIFGWTLNPMFGALAMSLSSFSVVSNALRLNFVKVYDTKHDRKIKHAVSLVQQETSLVKEIEIKGMMCTHCQGRVQNALEALKEVKQADVDYQTGKAIIYLNEDIENQVLIDCISQAGYKVKKIKKRG